MYPRRAPANTTGGKNIDHSVFVYTSLVVAAAAATAADADTKLQWACRVRVQMSFGAVDAAAAAVVASSDECGAATAPIRRRRHTVC